jgi:O-antigen ligase
MDPALAVATAVKATGVVVVALLAAGAALLPSARARAWAMAGALVLTPVLLVGEIWSTPQFHPVRDRPALALAAAAVGLVALAGLALAIERRPGLLALLAAAAIPFRVPIQSGGATANLLVPLYLVVAAGVLAYIRARLREPDRTLPPPRPLEWALLGAVALYGLQATYSTDFSKALEQVVFFYVPFALLFVLLRELDWTPRLALQCFGVLVGLALVFAGIGFVEYRARELLLNPKVINSNQFESYFRVNSLFFDPNIYGRFLDVAMIGLAAVLLWPRRPRDVALAAAALAVLWGGLVLTFSQSSFGALLVGLGVLAGLRWNARWTLAVAGAAAVLAAGFVLAFPGALRLDIGRSASVDKATSGRAKLITGGVRLFADRPLEGYGAGSFSREYRRHESASSERAVSASHTIPVTVAAEQGALGLAVYLALLATALWTLLRGARHDPLRAAVAAAFAALVFHTLLYAAFLEDPLAWALLGIGLALSARSAAPAAPAATAAPAP